MQGYRKLLRTFTSRLTKYYSKEATAAMSNQNLVLKEKQGRVFLIGINRPEKRNCVNTATAIQLYKALKEFDADPDTDVAVLHGKGGTFCAGYDLKEVSELSSDTQKPFQEQKFDVPDDWRHMGASWVFTRKPVIAAINGYAVAGGLELALWCDLRVVEETAVMGVFCRRFGVPLIDGGTVRLPKLIGLSRALDLILTGRPVTGKEALEIGLANRLVACGTAVGQAIQLANSLTKFPQECMRADRQSAYYSSYDAKDMTDAMNYEYDNGIKVVLQESVQGARNFVSGVGRHGSFNLLKKDASKL